MERIGNLRVMVMPDGKAWFAQGLEIDYGAQGDSVEQAKSHFVRCLRLTIEANQKQFGHLDGVLRPAPYRAWREMYKRIEYGKFERSTEPIGLPIPFECIEYFVVAAKENTKCLK